MEGVKLLIDDQIGAAPGFGSGLGLLRLGTLRLGVSPAAMRRSPAFKLSMPVYARILDIYWTPTDIKNINN